MSQYSTYSCLLDKLFATGTVLVSLKDKTVSEYPLSKAGGTRGETDMRLIPPAPDNHTAVFEENDVTQFQTRSCAPPTWDALLRPAFIVSPPLYTHELLPKVESSNRPPLFEPLDCEDTHNLPFIPTGRAFDLHMSDHLRLHQVAPLQDSTLRAIMKRWRALVRETKELNNISPDSEGWLDIQGEWSRIAGSRSVPMDSTDIGVLQTLVMQLLEPVLTVVSRIVICAATGGVSILPAIVPPVIALTRTQARTASNPHPLDYCRPAVVASIVAEESQRHGMEFIVRSSDGVMRLCCLDSEILRDPATRTLFPLSLTLPYDNLWPASAAVDGGSSIGIVYPTSGMGPAARAETAGSGTSTGGDKPLGDVDSGDVDPDDAAEIDIGMGDPVLSDQAHLT